MFGHVSRRTNKRCTLAATLGPRVNQANQDNHSLRAFSVAKDRGVLVARLDVVKVEITRAANTRTPLFCLDHRSISSFSECRDNGDLHFRETILGIDHPSRRFVHCSKISRSRLRLCTRRFKNETSLRPKILSRI